MTDVRVAAEYLRLRKEHPSLSANQAMLWARGNLKPTELKWETFEGNHFAVGRGERDGFDVRVVVDYDEYPSQTAPTPTDDDTGIRNPDFEYDEYDYQRGKRFLELESGSTVRELAPYYNRAGASKSVAWERARESLQEEAEAYLSDDYVQLVYRAEVSVGGAKLGEEALGSDLIIDYRTLEKELDNTVVETGIIEEAIEQAKENLPSLVAKVEEAAAYLTI